MPQACVGLARSKTPRPEPRPGSRSVSRFHVPARCGALLLLALVPAIATAGVINLVTDPRLVLPAPQAPRPGYLVPARDATFGTSIVRVTGDSGSVVGNGIAGAWSGEARHHLDLDQPWNSDGTLLAIQNQGAPTLMILDGETYAPRYARCPGYSGDDRWHPSPAHPHERISVNGTQLQWFDVVQCVATRRWTLPFAVNYIGSGYGNPSADGRFLALADATRMFVVDMDPAAPYDAYPAERIGPAYDLTDCGLPGGCRVSSVTVSPSGKYVVVKYSGDVPRRVFNVDPGTLALTPRAMPLGSASCEGTDPALGYVYDVDDADLTRNPFDNDEDVLVGREHCGNRGKRLNGKLIGGVVMVRLRDNAVTSLTDPTNEAIAQGVSARNDQRPGWIYASYYAQAGKRFSDEIVAVKLDGSGAVERLAHKRSAYKACPRCAAHPVPSRDGLRVMWASNWSTDCAPCGESRIVSAFVADVRSDEPPANRSPNGVIDSPSAALTITAGDKIKLEASGSDPDGDLPLAFHWNLGGGSPDSDAEDPGQTRFSTPGVYTLTLTVTDARGLSDPTPAQVAVTVLEGQPPGPPAHEVHWTFTGPTSVTLNWREGASSVRYGLTTDYNMQAEAATPSIVPFSSAGPFREARITGLSPDALYHYSIGGGSDHTFRTPPAHGETGFDVFVAGDVGSSRAYREVPALQQLIAADLPRFTLMVGDLTYANHHGQRAVEQHFEDVMPWSQDAAYMPAWGNHEWDIPDMDDLRNYKGRFELPNQRTSPGSPAVSCCGEDWYWFDYGNARFIAYPEPWVGAWLDWSLHAESLMNEAGADTAIDFIVTFGHRPAYSSGHHPGSASIKKYLDGLGLRHPKYVLNLNGHSHNYERTHPQHGVVHVTAGGGGGGLQDDPKNGCIWRGGCPPPEWSAFRAMHHSVVKLSFSAGAIEGWAICGPPDTENDLACTLGSPMDHFVIGTVRDTSVDAPTDSMNLVANPSFETSLSGWGASGLAAVSRVPGGFDDEYCAEVSGRSGNSLHLVKGWIGINDTPNWIASTAAGERFRMTAWVRSPRDSGIARIRVREYQNNVLVAPPMNSEIVQANTEWAELTLDYTALRDGSTLDVQMLYDPDGHNPTIQFDEVSIERVTATSARSAPGKLVQEWLEDDIEDGGGAAALGAREDPPAAFAARLHPSPLRERSVLSFGITRRGLASVTLFDIHGRIVRRLIDEADLGVGRHEVTLDGRGDRGQRLEPGVYLYRVHAAEGVLSGRCVILQ